MTKKVYGETDKTSIGKRVRRRPLRVGGAWCVALEALAVVGKRVHVPVARKVVDRDRRIGVLRAVRPDPFPVRVRSSLLVDLPR